MTYLPLRTPAASTAEDPNPIKETNNPCRDLHRGVCLPGAHRPRSTLRNQLAAFVRARAHCRPLALRVGMAGARRDRDAGVGLEPMRLVSVTSRLLVQRVEQLRDSAGEPVPAGVARSARQDVAGAGSLARYVCGAEVRLAVGGLGVPACSWVVLT